MPRPWWWKWLRRASDARWARPWWRKRLGDSDARWDDEAADLQHGEAVRLRGDHPIDGGVPLARWRGGGDGGTAVGPGEDAEEAGAPRNGAHGLQQRGDHGALANAAALERAQRGLVDVVEHDVEREEVRQERARDLGEAAERHGDGGVVGREHGDLVAALDGGRDAGLVEHGAEAAELREAREDLGDVDGVRALPVAGAEAGYRHGEEDGEQDEEEVEEGRHACGS